MADLVQDADLTMEWEVNKWVKTKKGNLICACKTFTNADGTDIDVMFTPFHVSIIEREPGGGEAMSLKEVKDLIKAYKSADYPDYDTGFVAFIDCDGVNEEEVERFKMQEHLDEMQERMKDLAPWGEESIVPMPQ